MPVPDDDREGGTRTPQGFDPAVRPRGDLRPCALLPPTVAAPVRAVFPLPGGPAVGCTDHLHLTVGEEAFPSGRYDGPSELPSARLCVW